MPSTGLPQEVTVRLHMLTSSQIQWACYKKWKVEWEAQTGMCQWSTSTFENSTGCTALDMPEWREMNERIDWRVDQPSQMASFSDDLKCWGAWDTTCRHKAKDITPSIAWRRGAWKEEVLDDLPWKDERGPSSVRRTVEPFQRQRWGNFWETGWSAYGLFRAHRYHLELIWTEVKCRCWQPGRHQQHARLVLHCSLGEIRVALSE